MIGSFGPGFVGVPARRRVSPARRIAGACIALIAMTSLAAEQPYPASVAELTFDSHGARLPGHAYLAAGAGPHPTVVLLHGFPGNERNLDLAQALRRAGFNAVFFHYRGAWGAEGTYRLAHLVPDAQAVLAYLRQAENAARLRVDRRALSVLGHSLGGYVALATGERADDLRCVMALSPANPGLWKRGLEADSAEVRQRLLPYADTLFMLRDFSAASLAEELRVMPMAALDTTGFAPGLRGKSVLLLVGADDTVTPAATMFEPARAAYAAKDDIDLTAQVISGDHSFSWSRLALGERIVNWAVRHCR
jgi:pimeloyl-ACP methyl ester carboxylesterase